MIGFPPYYYADITLPPRYACRYTYVTYYLCRHIFFSSPRRYLHLFRDDYAADYAVAYAMPLPYMPRCRLLLLLRYATRLIITIFTLFLRR